MFDQTFDLLCGVIKNDTELEEANPSRQNVIGNGECRPAKGSQVDESICRCGRVRVLQIGCSHVCTQVTFRVRVR